METLLGLALCLLLGGVVGHFWPSSTSETAPETPQDVLDELSEAIEALDARLNSQSAALDALKSTEATREANTLDALDKFGRLYKRLAERQSREVDPESTNEPEVSPVYLSKLRRG